MNILIITPWYPTVDHIYAGVFVREYAKAIQNRCNVIVLHCGIIDQSIPHWWATVKIHENELTDGLPSFRVLYRPSRNRIISFMRYNLSVYRAVVYLSKIYGKPDLIHAHVYISGCAALLTGRMFGIPVIISEHSTAFPRGLVTHLRLWLARFVFRSANVVLPVSNALKKTLHNMGINASFQVIPNVVDTGLFQYRPLQSNSNGVLRLLTVSSLMKHKGLDYLFQALTMIPWENRDWILDVIGDGPEADHYFQMVKNLRISDNVIFHGQMFKKDVAQMMQCADIFVLPSIVETFSVSSAEAKASGLPSLVTRCGGPEEFINERSGMVITPGNTEELASALTRMIDHLSTYDRSAIANEAKDQFGMTCIGTKLYELYVRLCNKI